MSNDEFRCKKEYTPRYLYKYFSNIQYALDVIENDRIHLESPDSYNDVFDGATTITKEHLHLLNVPTNVVDAIVDFTHREQKEKIKFLISDLDFSKCQNMQQVVELLKNNNIPLSILDNMLDNFVRSFKNNLKFPNNLITCFSEINNSELMWAHYGNHLKGVCLCFDTTLDKELFQHVQKINYSQHRPTIALGNFNIYFTKSLEWNYEQEWRLVVDRKPEDCFISTKSCVGLILGANLSFENTNRKLVKTEIIDGNSVDKIEQETLCGWGALTIAAGKKGLHIYKAVPDPYKFKIIIQEWGQNEIQI